MITKISQKHVIFYQSKLSYRNKLIKFKRILNKN